MLPIIMDKKIVNNRKNIVFELKIKSNSQWLKTIVAHVTATEINSHSDLVES
jgi:hypothetical protein